MSLGFQRFARSSSPLQGTFLALLLLALPSQGRDGLGAASVPQTPSLSAYGKLPLYFEANEGQAGEQIQFLARGQGYGFFLSPREAVITLGHPTKPNQRHTGAVASNIRMQFVGARGDARMSGAEALPGKVNYLLGQDEAKWRRGISTFAKVRYEELYPGVDLVCYGNQRQLEYDFIVAPGANPKVISLHFDGIEGMEIDSSGDLVLRASGKEIRQRKPIIYQTVEGIRKQIEGGYVLREGHTASFEVAAYDAAKPLIIDPILAYSTYRGGLGLDVGWDIAVDTDGNAYLAGETLSSLPNLSIPGAFQTNWAGGFADRTNLVGGDVFVAKLDPTGSSFIYFTYLGGRGDDGALGIAVDGAGNACVTGFTDSTNFPTQNPIQSGIHGVPDPFFVVFPFDGFVAKLDATGSTLLYSTYLGGNGKDEGVDIALDPSGNIYVTGFTASTNFPITVNGLQKQLNTRTNNVGIPTSDAFVTKIDPTQTGTNALIYSTFLGSIGPDEGHGIAVDAAGNAFVTGVMDLFGQRDVLGTILFDSFVAELDPTGSSLIYAQLLHGSSNDVAFRLTLDAAGSAYVTGSTESGDFPTTPNGLNQGGVFKSTDGGANWTLSSSGLTRSFVGSLAIDPANPSTLYAGTAAGVFKSIDAGGSWSNNADALQFAVLTNTITSTNIVTTNENVRSTNTVFFTNALGVPVTFWLNSPNALGYHLVTSLAFDPTDSAHLYAGTAGGGPYSSEVVVQTVITNIEANVTNSFSAWFGIFGTNGILVNPNVNAFVVDPLLPSVLYAGTSGSLFKSTNGGATWFSGNLGFTVIKALAIAPNASVLYAGAVGGVARTSNRGTNWTLINGGLGNVFVNTLVLDPTTPTTVYAGTDGGIFKSVNGGTNWVVKTNGLISRKVNVLAIDPSDAATLYAGTTNGLFKSSDGGNSWNVATNGLTTTNIASLAIDPSSPGTVYAGTGSTNSFGSLNCFVSKISPDGSGLIYSTVLGGNGSDTGWDVAVDAGGNAFVTGGTTSTNFPIADAPSPAQATNSGASDAFFFELNPDGSALITSFLFGGKGNDIGHGLGMDAAGNAYVIGETASVNFPTVGPLQPAFGGGASDVFITKISPTVIAQPRLRVARSGNNLALSWPVSSSAFALEVNTNGMHPTDWSPVPQAPTVNHGTNTVTVNAIGGHQTFRLKRK